MRLKRLFFMWVTVGMLMVPSLLSAMSSDEIAQKASAAVYKRCLDSAGSEGLQHAQIEQLCEKTVKKYMELASSEEVAEAAADDFKEGASAMVFEICYKIVLKDFKK